MIENVAKNGFRRQVYRQRIAAEVFIMHGLVQQVYMEVQRKVIA